MTNDTLRDQLTQSGYQILRVHEVEPYFVIQRYSLQFRFLTIRMIDFYSHEEANNHINKLIQQSPGKYFNDAFISDPETLKLLKPETFKPINRTVISTHPLV